MPIVRMTVLEGASAEQKQAMYREVTEAIHRALGAPRENVRIMLNEIAAANFAHAGVAADQEPSALPER